MEKDFTKLTLRSVKVIFANLEDTGFGRSITIDATDENIRKNIAAWVEVNKIGKGDKAGIANFKEWAPEGSDKTIQFTFKINDYTKFAGINGLSKDDIGYGAIIDLIARAYEYDNKFGKAWSQSLSAVSVVQARRTGADSDMEELIDSEPDTEQVESVDTSEIPF